MGLHPVKASYAQPVAQQPVEPPQPNRDEAVDKFISEFKEEMKKISPDDDLGIPVENIPPAETKPNKSSTELNWDENLEDLSEPEIRNLSKDMVNKIAENVSEKIVSKLDEDTIYTLFKEAINEYIKNKK